jgi:VID27 C-terminal WD40-like domain
MGLKIDAHMLLKNPEVDNKIYQMDLEYGKVVDEWQVDENIPIEEMCPTKKHDQVTGEQTLLGLNSSSLFQLDPRLSGNKIVTEKAKHYATKNKFSAMATTGKGELAVGSSKGEIRLFDRLGINAKTLLPGLGDPIIGMDTTDNGKFILATCKNCN